MAPQSRVAAASTHEILATSGVVVLSLSRAGLDERTALKVACAYGGGVARSGETCGAVNGALMVIGLAHGKATVHDDAAKERTYALTREFWKPHRRRHPNARGREGSLREGRVPGEVPGSRALRAGDPGRAPRQHQAT